MSNICISTADADKLLAYIRKEINDDNEAFEKFLKVAEKSADEEIKKAKEAGLDVSGDMGQMAKEFAIFMARKKHEQKMADLVHFVEVLTCGSSDESKDVTEVAV